MRGGTLAAQYFMPHATRPSTTAAVTVGTAAVTAVTVIAEIAGTPKLPVDVITEHPSGRMPREHP